MRSHRHRKYKRYYPRRSLLKWSELKLYLGIAVLCFIIAGGLNYVVTKGSNLVDRVGNIATIADNLPEGATLDKIMDLQQSAGTENGQLTDALKGTGGNLSEKDINRVKQNYKENLSQEEIERLKDAYRQFKGQ